MALPELVWLKSIICLEPDNRCVLAIALPPLYKGERQDRAGRLAR
jgi:hypothetical protein